MLRKVNATNSINDQDHSVSSFIGLQVVDYRSVRRCGKNWIVTNKQTRVQRGDEGLYVSANAFYWHAYTCTHYGAGNYVLAV